MTTLYDVLGVAKNATQNEIKDAFRRRARSLHPDAGGGTEAFQALNHAYQILSDEKMRRRYDATGDDDAATINSANRHAMELAFFVINEILNTATKQGRDVEQFDLLLTVADSMRQKVDRELTPNMQTMERTLAKFERVLKRVKAKNKKKNVLLPMFEHRRAEMRKQIDEVKDAIETHQRAIKLVEEHQYEFDDVQMQTHTMHSLFVQWRTP